MNPTTKAAIYDLERAVRISMFPPHYPEDQPSVEKARRALEVAIEAEVEAARRD